MCCGKHWAHRLVFIAPLLLPSPAWAQPEDVVLPRLLEHTEVPYPPSELNKGSPVTVVLVVVVERDGSTGEATVAESGGQAFDAAALVAIRGWRFLPARHGDRPFRSRVRVPITFAPHGSPGPEPPEVEKAPLPAPPGAKAPPGAAPVPAPKRTPALPHHDHDEPHAEVTVFGVAQQPGPGTSTFNVRIGALSIVPRKNAAELLKLAPGILLTSEGGDGHAEQIFLRGFDAREGQDLELTVGGVPINESGNLHGNGYADTHFILPELVSSLRVIEGPFDPHQGNYAVAGSADFALALQKRGLSARYTGGSFNSHRLLLLWGPPGQSERTFGGAEIYTTDGFGQNRDSKRATAMGQYEGKLGETSTFRVTGMAYLTAYHSAGVLRADDVERGRKGFFDTYDFGQGGDASRFSLSGDIASRSAAIDYQQQLFAIYRGMRLRENFTGFLLDVQTPLQQPHPQRGDLLDLDSTAITFGARGSARLKREAFGRPQELELGYFARGDVVRGTQSRLEAGTGHPYHLETDLSSKLGDIGLFVDGALRPLSWVTLRGGLRADLFAYDVLDNCAVGSVSHPSKIDPPGDASCLSQQSFGAHREPFQRASTASLALLPRASLSLGSFRGFRFGAGIGKGARSIDPSYITQDVKTPFASVLAYEGGVEYAGGSDTLAVAARSIVFQTRVDRDLIFSQTAGRNLLGGGTTRTGWVGAVRVTGEHFDVNANATLVKSIFDDTKLLVPYAPDAVIRADAAWFGELPLTILGERFRGAIGSGLTFVGHRPLPYGQRSNVIFTLDASATLSWSHYEIGLSLTNLTGTQYRLGEYNFASDFRTEPSPTLVPVRHFTAGAPRAVYGTVAVNFGGN